MMRRAFAGALLLAGMMTTACAQTSPGLVFGQVPTAGQWNSYFAAKQDYLGFTPIAPANISGIAPIVSTILGPTVRISILPLTGDVTTPSGSSVTTLATVNANVGTFGSATQVGTFTVDAKGRITAASNATIAPGGGPAGGDLAGTYPNPLLASILTAGGPIGSATSTPIITYDAKGRLTIVSSATIAPPFSVITGREGVQANILHAVTANYTIAASDFGNTIQAGTGSTGQFTITLPSVSGFAANAVVTIYNADTAHGKILSGFPTGYQVLWPLQTIVMQIVNGAWTVQSDPGRWRFPANETFNFDRAIGNNSNDCLSASTACASLQGIYTKAASQFDINDKFITFQGAGSETYTNGEGQLSTNTGLVGQTDGTKIIIDFAGSTCNMTNGLYCYEVGGGIGAKTVFTVQNEVFTASSGGGIDNFGGLIIGGAGLNFGAVTLSHVKTAHTGAITFMTADYTISGGAAIHADVETGGLFVTHGRTVTCTGSPAFTAFFTDTFGAGANYFAGGMTFTGCGGVTGSRYAVFNQGLIDLAGVASATYFPGNAAGGASLNGLYSGPTQGAFQTYIPTVTCGSGSLTTFSASASWTQTYSYPSVITFQTLIGITTNGTCAGSINVSLPPGVVANSYYTLSGGHVGVGVATQGYIGATTSVVQITNVDGTYPGASGQNISVSGFFGATQ